MQQTAILITGAPHSGTRLLTNMIGKHPEVSLPEKILNPVGEFYPWHTFFVNALDKTPLYSEKYNFDFKEMKFILDRYLENLDSQKPYFIIKMPYYPLNCLDFLVEYFNDKIYILFTVRNKQKILKSFESRAVDQRYFKDPQAHLKQIKKLNIKLRKEYLSKPYAYEIISHLIDETLRKKEEWNNKNLKHQIIDVDIDKLAKKSDYFEKILSKIKLEPKNTQESYKILDKKRLSLNLKTKFKNFFKKRIYSLKYKHLT